VEKQKGVIRLIPYIQKGQLSLLPEKRKRKICSCPVLCEEFYTIAIESEDVVLCEREAKEFGFQLFEKLGIVTEKKAFTKSKCGWTTEQEAFIRRYLKDKNLYYNGKIKYGTYSLIGEMLGKSRYQVKDKIHHMQKEGKL
jgi:hypothetical protein